MTLLFGDESDDLLNAIASENLQSSVVQIVNATIAHLLRRKDIDAFFATYTFAEQVAKISAPVSGKAQVFQVVEDSVGRGLPPLVVAGGVVSVAQSKDPVAAFKILLRAVLDAINIHNDARAEEQIRRVAMPCSFLGIRELGGETAGAAIKSVIDDFEKGRGHT